MRDEVLDALADGQRRRLLCGLLHHDSQFIPRLSGASHELTEANEKLLSRHLASSREVPEADEELLCLHVIHLPKLAANGFIEWDREANVVRRGPRFDDVRPLLELLANKRSEQRVEDRVQIRRQ